MDTSYLAQQVTTIIGQLHGLFDDIGVPSHERDSREAELFSALSETLHNQLKLVTNEKHEMTEEANRLIKTIQQMEASLDDTKLNHTYGGESELKVSYPLTHCVKDLKEKYNHVGKLHRERFAQVKKLVEALESYASHLEPSFVQIKLPPTSPNAPLSPSFDLSPSYVNSLDNEFTRIYEEYMRRVDLVKTVSDEIIMMWAELGTPQAQTDSAIVKHGRESPEQLGLHQEDLDRLREKKEKLIEEKRNRERRLKDLRANIEALWDKLGIEEPERKGFLTSNRGCGLRTINEFESELRRLNELKRQNLHLFIEDARFKLQELWDGLYFSEEEMLDFTPAFSDVVSDALLSAHEAEIERLEALKEQRLPALQLIDRHRQLVKDRNDLQASSQDASRLMARGNKGEKRDPTRLLREEKMRKRIAKELPKLEAELTKFLENWEDEYGRPFLVHGDRYLDEIHAAAAATKPAPSRSKTPSVAGAPPAARSAKSAPPSRAGTMRGAPARSKTPTANQRPQFSMSTSRHAMPGSDSTGSSNRSPSRVPTRPPLKNMPYGNNSPERESQKEDSTIRKMPPPRVPPPRMKDLFIPPPAQTPSNLYSQDDPRSASVVRNVAPEDVYDDRSHSYSLKQSTISRPPMSNTSSFSHEYPHAPSVASSRQTSATSSVVQTVSVSGSENWETYDDASEPEIDASDAYYAKLRGMANASQPCKRLTPEGGYTSPHSGYGKKLRGIRSVPSGPSETMVEQNGHYVRENGCEAGWADEDGYQ